MIALTSALPIIADDFDVPGFDAWVRGQGWEPLKVTNPFEVYRYRRPSMTGVCVVYRKAGGELNFHGDTGRHYLEFLTWADTPAAQVGDGKMKPKRVENLNADAKARAIRRIRMRDGDGCWFCGQSCRDNVTLEHLLSRTHGGNNHDANLALAHIECNATAGDLPLVAKIEMRETLRHHVIEKGSPRLRVLAWIQQARNGVGPLCTPEPDENDEEESVPWD